MTVPTDPTNGNKRGRRPWKGAVFFVTFNEDGESAEVRFVPTEEEFEGEFAYGKFEGAVKALTNLIDDDDGPKAHFFREKGIAPAIRHQFADVEAGEVVTVSLKAEDYEPATKARGRKAKTDEDDDDDTVHDAE